MKEYLRIDRRVRYGKAWRGEGRERGWSTTECLGCIGVVMERVRCAELAPDRVKEVEEDKTGSLWF